MRIIKENQESVNLFLHEATSTTLCSINHHANYELDWTNNLIARFIARPTHNCTLPQQNCTSAGVHQVYRSGLHLHDYVLEIYVGYKRRRCHRTLSQVKAKYT
jgi:hypothetical protein